MGRTLKRLEMSLPLRRLTVKQALGAERNEESTVVYIDGVEQTSAVKVMVVGWVSELFHNTNNVRFYLEDGTGKIKCSMWGDVQYRYTANHISHGSLVRALGTVVVDSKSTTLSIYHISEVEDGNYLAYHFLMCMEQYREIREREEEGEECEKEIARYGAGGDPESSFRADMREAEDSRDGSSSVGNRARGNVKSGAGYNETFNGIYLHAEENREKKAGRGLTPLQQQIVKIFTNNRGAGMMDPNEEFMMRRSSVVSMLVKTMKHKKEEIDAAFNSLIHEHRMLVEISEDDDMLALFNPDEY